MAYGQVTVYWNRSRGYLVQPMWKKATGGSGHRGEPLLVTEEDFESQITDVVLGSLGLYDAAYDPSLTIRLTETQQREFVQMHESASVEQLEDGAIEICPMKRKGVGYAGTGEVVRLEPREILQGLPTALKSAFRRDR